MSDPTIIDAAVALIGATNKVINTVTAPPEERLIIIAQGKMFRNEDPCHAHESAGVVSNGGQRAGSSLCRNI
jgi:hypothetical protein